MTGILTKPKIPKMPEVGDPVPMPTANTAEVRLASRRAISSRMQKSGRLSTALSDIKVGL
jgi:hypothetical protein